MIDSEDLKTLTALFKKAMNCFEASRNGAFPLETYSILYDVTRELQPGLIFEAGTGYGVSTAALALATSQTARITTVDKDEEVIDVAKNVLQKAIPQQYEKISFVSSQFRDFLVGRDDNTFDMTVFDGFAPGLTVFLELERVLCSGGLMFCANLNLRGDRRKITQRMTDLRFYRHTIINEDIIYGLKQ